MVSQLHGAVRIELKLDSIRSPAGADLNARRIIGSLLTATRYLNKRLAFHHTDRFVLPCEVVSHVSCEKKVARLGGC